MGRKVKTKIVYVLVSDPDDHFTEMAILSAYCARKYSQVDEIELVVDSKTKSNLAGHRVKLLNSVDTVTEVDLIGQNNAFTSRLIKTQLRKFVQGDYLYVDIDAIPVSDLRGVFDSKHDLAMANDHNLPPEKFVFYDYEREIFDKTGWPLPENYFNSGVMYVKDNTMVHKFFDTWHSLWQTNSSMGLHKDQPPMHEAIRREDISVETLEPSWNILVGLQKGYGAKNPKVYHYSTNRFNERTDTYFHQMVRDIKISGSLDEKYIEEVIESKFPWTNSSSIRLNLAVGNYHKLPKILLSRLLLS